MTTANPTTTGPDTQIAPASPPEDARTPYRVYFAETTYRALDVLAGDEQEAHDIAAANTEYAVETGNGDLEINLVRECYALDFTPINE